MLRLKRDDGVGNDFVGIWISSMGGWVWWRLMGDGCWFGWGEGWVWWRLMGGGCWFGWVGG